MLTREKVRPARHKTLILGHFEHAGRTFSRTGSCDVATLKPMTPLQPLIQASMKPPSPLHAPEQQPLKPPSPLQPKNAPKTPISHPQRRWGFQLRLALREQRRWWFHLRLGLREQRRWWFHLRLALREQRRRRFHARDFQCTRAMAGPGRAPSQRTEPHISDQAPLCGGRRRDRRAWLRRPWAAAGPGRASRRRAERSSLRGRLAGGPPPTGAQSSPARRVRPDGTRNTSGATSNARAPARHSKRGRHQPTPCASALTHP